MWRSVPSNDTEPLSLTGQVKQRRREQLASLRTGAAITGKRAAILSASGWGSKVVLEAKNLRSAWGRGGGGFIITSATRPQRRKPRQRPSPAGPSYPWWGVRQLEGKWGWPWGSWWWGDAHRGQGGRGPIGSVRLFPFGEFLVFSVVGVFFGKGLWVAT